MVERIQRLEDTQERQARKRRWEPRRATRHYMHYGSQKEEEDWRVQNFEAKRHQHENQQKKSIPFVKLPSFNGDNDPNIYLGWEVKVEQMSNGLMFTRSKRIKRLS